MLELNLPRRFNAAEYFVDRNVAEGRGEQTAILFEDQSYSYRQFLENVNRLAKVLIVTEGRPALRSAILHRNAERLLGLPRDPLIK